MLPLVLLSDLSYRQGGGFCNLVCATFRKTEVGVQACVKAKVAAISSAYRLRISGLNKRASVQHNLQQHGGDHGEIQRIPFREKVRSLYSEIEGSGSLSTSSTLLCSISLTRSNWSHLSSRGREAMLDLRAITFAHRKLIFEI